MENIKLKKCCGCKLAKTRDNFYMDRSRKDGKTTWCKDCQKKWIKTYRLENRERLSKYHQKYIKGWYLKNKDKIKIRLKKNYEKNKEAYKERDKKTYFHRYGITYEDAIKKWEEQKRKCAICGMELLFRGTNLKRGFCIDHDHITGKFRGILCHNCNSGMGMFKENLEFIKSAVKYLENFL